jgi:hypothetical protein
MTRRQYQWSPVSTVQKWTVVTSVVSSTQSVHSVSPLSQSTQSVHSPVSWSPVVVRCRVQRSARQRQGKGNGSPTDRQPARRLDLGTSAVGQQVHMTLLEHRLTPLPACGCRRQHPAWGPTTVIGDAGSSGSSAGIRPPSPRCESDFPSCDSCNHLQPKGPEMASTSIQTVVSIRLDPHTLQRLQEAADGAGRSRSAHAAQPHPCRALRRRS